MTGTSLKYALIFGLTGLFLLVPNAWGASTKNSNMDMKDRGADTVTQGITGKKTAPLPATETRPVVKESAKQESELEQDVLRARIAQLMFVTLGGLGGPDEQDRTLIAKCTPGGVVIPLLREPRSAADYINAVRELANEQQRGTGLFIATDLSSLPRHENNTKSAFVQLPTPMAVAAAASTATTESTANFIATHLQSMGFNVCLGPALDLAPTLSGAKGSVQNFGADPVFTAQVAEVFTKTINTQGILTMPTGFPGGGLNRLGNSPATLLTPRARWLEEDGRPYARAIECGTKLIQVSPTLVSGFDESSRPACLSRGVMTDLLRTEMKYDGIIVAGPMDSSDIERLANPAEAAVVALANGADMILWKSSGQRINNAVESIVLAVQQGRISKTTLIDACTRVESIKKAAGLLTRPAADIGKATALGKKNKYPEEAYSIERRSITLLQNQKNVLPLSKENSLPIGVTGVVGVEELKEPLEKRLKQVVMQPIETAKHVGDIEDFEIQRLTAHAGGAKTVICIFNDSPRTAGAVRLVQELKKRGSRVVVVLLGYPRHAPLFKEADAIVLAYSYDADCSQSLRAVADVLLGDAPLRVMPAKRPIKVQSTQLSRFNALDLVCAPGGILPISLSSEFPCGYAASYDSSASVKKVVWNFGDGEEAKGLQPEHTYKTPGTYTITLTVTDRQDESSTGTFQVVVE